MKISVDDSDKFKQRDAGSYDEVSESFALFTQRFSQPIAAHMTNQAALGESDQVLDVGTGTGVVAIEAARRLGASGHVTAIDLSTGMLSTAKRLAALDPSGVRISWHSMDAEALTLEDAAFDVVLSLFALLHFPNPLAALREMQRVLKPGGRLVVALGSRPSLASPAGLGHAVEMLPRLLRRRLGRELVAPAFLDALVEKYLPAVNADEQSALAGHGSGRTEPVHVLVRQAGFVDISSAWVGYNHKLDTPEEFWELQRTFSSLARKRINEAPPEKVEALKEVFLTTCERVVAGGGALIYPVGVLTIGAGKPSVK